MMMTAESSSHRALLEIIQEKERELTQIRHVADTAAQEEKKTVQQQFIELQSDFEHNIRLLYDKDETINSLHQRINEMEKDHMQAMRRVEERCNESANIYIDKISAQAEVDHRKRLQKEYEDKLSCRERELEKEYQLSILHELRNQEASLYHNFDKMVSDRDSEHSQCVKELRNKMATKEEEISELVRAYEKNLRDQEAHVLGEVKAQCQSEARIQLEGCERQYKVRIAAIEEDKEQIMRDLYRVGQDRSQLEVANRELDWKVNELLDIIQNLERGYIDKTGQYESQKNSMETLLKELRDKTSTLEATLSRREECHRQELENTEKRSRADKKALSHALRKLKKELASTKEEKEEVEGLVKDKEDEVKNSKRQLKDKVSSLAKECNSLREEIGVMHTKTIADRQNDYSRKETMEVLLFDRKEGDAKARKKLLEQFERTMKQDREAFMQEKLRLVRERDDAIMEKEAADLVSEQKRKDYEALKAELSSVTNKLRSDIAVQRKENEVLKSNHYDIHQQNLQLKDSIKTMRAEMEKLMTSYSASLQSQDYTEKKPPIAFDTVRTHPRSHERDSNALEENMRKKEQLATG